MGKIKSFRESGPRYPALRVVGLLCSLAGTILMVIGCLLLAFAGLYALAERGGPVAVPPQVVAGVSLLWSFAILFSGLQLIAIGGFLRLMIHVEENTRASAQALDRIRSRLEPNPDGIEAIFGP